MRTGPTTPTRRRLVAACLAAGLLLGACGGDGEPTGDATGSTGASGSAAQSGGGTTPAGEAFELDIPAPGGLDTLVPSSTPGAGVGAAETPDLALPSQRMLALLRSWDDAGLTVDVAEVLTGQTAITQAEADGGEVDPELGDDAYYVRNKNAATVRVVFTPQTTFGLIDQASCCDVLPFDRAEFLDVLSFPDDNLLGPGSYYWLTVSGDQLVSVEEAYFP